MKLKKKLMALVAVLTLVLTSVFGLTACDNKTDWDYIQSKGKIVVGYTDYPPLDIKNNQNVLDAGFDYELAIAVGKKLGVEVEFKEITWSQKVMDLNSKKVDLLWNGMTVSEELKKELNFSNSYMKNQQVAVVLADATYTDFDSVKAVADNKIGAEDGSAGLTFIEDKIPGKKAVALDKQLDIFTQLSTNKIEVGILDSVFANYYINLDSNKGKFKTVSLPSNQEQFAIGMRKDDTEFAKKLNGALAELKEDNTIATLAKKYGLSSEIL